jgi:hypothetical protein
MIVYQFDTTGAELPFGSMGRHSKYRSYRIYRDTFGKPVPSAIWIRRAFDVFSFVDPEASKRKTSHHKSK